MCCLCQYRVRTTRVYLRRAIVRRRTIARIGFADFAVEFGNELRRGQAAPAVDVHVGADVPRYIPPAFCRFEQGNRPACALLVGKVEGGRVDFHPSGRQFFCVIRSEPLHGSKVGGGVFAQVAPVRN